MVDFEKALKDKQESPEEIDRKYLMQLMWDAQCDDDEVEETVEAIMEWNKKMIGRAVQQERNIFLDEEEVVCVRCGTVNEYDVHRSGDHVKATCQNCGKYIKFVRQAKTEGDALKDDSVMPYGKHKGEKLIDIPDEYFLWMYDNDKLSPPLRKYVEDSFQNKGK